MGSNNDAFSASSSFSNRRDSSNSSGLRKEKKRRCVCRKCATNRMYSAACSGVISCKFWICGHFGVSIYNLSFFRFRCLYGAFRAVLRRASSFPLFLCTRFRFFGYTSRFFDRLFGNRVVAPKERTRSRPVIIRANTAKIIIYIVMITERATSAHCGKYLRWHITVILRRSNRKRVV